jgi:hypothetical protein
LSHFSQFYTHGVAAGEFFDLIILLLKCPYRHCFDAILIKNPVSTGPHRPRSTMSGPHRPRSTMSAKIREIIGGPPIEAPGELYRGSLGFEELAGSLPFTDIIPSAIRETPEISQGTRRCFLVELPAFTNVAGPQHINYLLGAR